MFSVPLEPAVDWTDAIILPGIAIFFGLLIYFLGQFAVGEGGKPKPWRFLGIVILFFGALLGFRYFLAMIGGSLEAVAYRDLIRGYGRRMVLSHYFAFLGPLILGFVCIIVAWVQKRAAIHEADL